MDFWRLPIDMGSALLIMHADRAYSQHNKCPFSARTTRFSRFRADFNTFEPKRPKICF